MSEGNRPPNPDRPQENEQPLAKLLNDKQPLARPIREEEEAEAAEATQAEAEQQELSRQVGGSRKKRAWPTSRTTQGSGYPRP